MADYDRRNGSSRGGFNNRKRRYRGNTLEIPRTSLKAKVGLDEDEFDRRPQRRRFEEPLQVKVRKQLLGIADSVSTL